MADHGQRTGSRPRGGLPARWARRATWTLVIGAALTVSAPPPAGWAAAGATAAAPTVAPEPPRYTLVALGTLGGATSQALAINERGDVVGDSSRSDGSTHGFLWRDGKMADLGVLPGGDFSSAQDINDRGEIAGVSGFARGARSAVVWRDGKIRALGTLPGGKISIGLAINAGGTVVGVSQSSDGNRAFEWRNGTMRNLGLLPGGSFSLARGINDEGVIVGQADAEDGTIHATRWANGRIEDLGQITTASGAAAASIAHAVGPDGLVIGYGATDGGALGAVWTGSTPRPVAALTGYAVAQLLGLNGFRQAVGDATDSAENRQIAVIVDLRRVPKSIPALFDLNTLVMNGAGWTISSGKDINDGWEIVGTGLYERAGACHPAPPPPVHRVRGANGYRRRFGRRPGLDRLRGTMRGALRAGDEADTPGAPRRRLAICPLAGCMHRHEGGLHARGRRRSRGTCGLRPGTTAVPLRGDLHDGLSPRNRTARGRRYARSTCNRLAHAVRNRHRRALRGTASRRDGTPRGETPVTGRRQRSVQRRLWAIGRARPLRSVGCDDRGERAFERARSRRLARSQVLPERRPASRGRGRSDRAHPGSPGLTALQEAAREVSSGGSRDRAR